VASILDTIENPQHLKRLKISELEPLASEIRALIIKTVSEKGGHLASSLGAVELIVALHYIFDTPYDSIVWDVGHQAYAHKILTSRRDRFHTLRQYDGLSGFPNKNESPYDPFTVGHGSTSISAALGLAAARDIKGTREKIIAVIGDGSLVGGMAFEAMNNVGHLKKDMIVVLNDNEFSISPSIGALSRYLNKIMINPLYNKMRRDTQALLEMVPKFGFRFLRAAQRLEEGIKNLLVPGMLFEEMGFRYIGPIDGHNIPLLAETFGKIKDMNEPILVHVLTKKGRGYEPAEKFPSHFHSVGPFDIVTGKQLKSKDDVNTFTNVFSEAIVAEAGRDKDVVAITAAMTDGTGLARFQKVFPERFFDVGMAEAHAVTFSAGLAKGGLRPVVAIYSTFLQRAYDQMIHDVCLQNLPVVFCLDRAGLVGEDGPTHHGTFDIAYLSHMPNMIVMAPKDGNDLRDMLRTALEHNGPSAIRFPKAPAGDQSSAVNSQTSKIPVGKAKVIKEGRDVAILALGSMVVPSVEAASILESKGVRPYIVDMRFAKPIDTALIESISARTKKFIVAEEGSLKGGMGSLVEEFLAGNIAGAEIDRIALPDEFITHGKRELLLKRYGLSADGIANRAIKMLAGRPLPERDK